MKYSAETGYFQIETGETPPQNTVMDILRGKPEDYKAGLELLIATATRPGLKSILLPIISSHSPHHNFDVVTITQTCVELGIIKSAEIQKARFTHESVMKMIADTTKSDSFQYWRGGATPIVEGY